MQSGGQGASGAVLAQAVAAHLAGRMDEAQELYQCVLATDPGDHVAAHLLGASYVQQGKLLDGIALLERALALKPDYADAHYNYGCALQALGRLDEAGARFAAALAIEPAHAAAHLNLGNALQAQGRHAEAIAHYGEVLALKPGDADAHNNWGHSLQALACHEEAGRHFELALKFRPDHVAALNNLGITLHALNRHEEALTRYGQALALAPDFAEGHCNLAHALNALGRCEAAIRHCEAALALKPGYAEAHNNWGIALHGLNRLDEALAHYDQAIALKADFAEALWNKSLALLGAGQFAAGWKLYEQRWQRKQTPALPDLGLSLWPGEDGSADAGRRAEPAGVLGAGSGGLAQARVPLRLLRRLRAYWRSAVPGAQRNILLQFEQGLGDALQMLRYVPLLEEIGMRCTIQVPPTLAALTQRSFPRARVAAVDACPAQVQYRIPMLSLPLAMKTFAEAEIPHTVPYLTVDQRKAAGWASRLANARRLTLGIAWRGRPTHKNDRNRSMPLELLQPLLARREVQFVTLQKDLTGAESDVLARHDNVTLLDRELESFDDTAAVVSVIDLVICVDSALAHLCAALGRATWVLLCFSPDWRWQLARSDSPWYPSARLIRQQAPGDWSGVIDVVAAARDARLRSS